MKAKPMPVVEIHLLRVIMAQSAPLCAIMCQSCKLYAGVYPFFLRAEMYHTPDNKG